MFKKLQEALISRQKKKDDSKTLSTQDVLDMEDIRDNLITTKDNRLVAIVWVSAINLDLMSKTEQKYVFESFESFVAGLDYNFQFETIAQPVNLREYTKQMINQYDQSQNPYKKRLLGSYVEYTDEHQTRRDVVKKEHYVIISEKIKGGDELAYQDALANLNERVEELKDEITGMMGQDFTLECKQLNNNQLIQLLQVYYNYQDAVHQPIETVEVPQFITGELNEMGKEEDLDVFEKQKVI